METILVDCQVCGKRNVAREVTKVGDPMMMYQCDDCGKYWSIEGLAAADTRLVGKNIEPLTKVRHDDYGTGHITADLGWAVEVYWDRPYAAGFATHLLPHDRAWVEQLERLD